jgi:serine/threonine-protein phosphatase 2A regulatory subunit B'
MKTMLPLFRQISACINSSHFQVAERALFLWNNDYIVNLVAQNRHALLPVCFGAFERNARSHWNAAVSGLTANVRKMLMEMDQQLYEECQANWNEEELRSQETEENRKQRWKQVEALAAKAGG